MTERRTDIAPMFRLENNDRYSISLMDANYITTQWRIDGHTIKALQQRSKPASVPPAPRQPLRMGYYPDAALRLRPSFNGKGFQFLSEGMSTGITANEAREASHLLAQLAEYLDALDNSISDQRGEHSEETDVHD